MEQSIYRATNFAFGDLELNVRQDKSKGKWVVLLGSSPVKYYKDEGDANKHRDVRNAWLKTLKFFYCGLPAPYTDAQRRFRELELVRQKAAAAGY